MLITAFPAGEILRKYLLLALGSDPVSTTLRNPYTQEKILI